MIEEEVYVEEVGDGVAWVVKNRPSACSACSEACPSALASDFFGGTRFRLQLDSNLALHPGDKVLLGISDDCLTRVSFGIYLLPLLFFFLGALAGEYLFSSDLAGILGGMSGLTLCFASFRSLGLFDRENCQAVILHKIN